MSSVIGQSINRNKLSDAVRSLAPALGLLPDKSLVLQLLANNPELLLDPVYRQVLLDIADAIARNELDKYLAGVDANKLINLVKV